MATPGAVCALPLSGQQCHTCFIWLEYVTYPCMSLVPGMTCWLVTRWRSMLGNRRSICSSLTAALGHQLPRVSPARVGSRFSALLSPMFLTFPSNVPSRYPNPACRPSCLIIPDFIRISIKKRSTPSTVFEADTGANFKVGWGKKLVQRILFAARTLESL